MRDIKFRAWDGHYKYMNYKVLVGMWGENVLDDENYTSCAMYVRPENVNYNCEPHWTHFEPYHKEIKLMQYTGLKDKNGKEIYEGDIVKIKTGVLRGKGMFSQGEVLWAGYDDGEYVDNVECWLVNGVEPLSDSGADKIEVIGNIYENPISSNEEDK